MKYIGKEMSRVDGVAKVTGAAKYAAEFQIGNAAYGFLVMSSIAKGSIKSIDVSEAEKSTGVVKIFTHLNAAKSLATDKQFRALQSEKSFLTDSRLRSSSRKLSSKPDSRRGWLRRITRRKNIRPTRKPPSPIR